MKKHTLAWFQNRIGQKVIRYSNFTNIIFTLTKDNCKPFYTSQKDFNMRYEILNK